MTKSSRLQVMGDYIKISAACSAILLAQHLLQRPNHFVLGGVTGLAMLLSSVTPAGFTCYTIGINLFLVAAGFFCLGRSFGVKTVYVTLFLSFGFQLLDQILPVGAPLTDQPLLELLFVTLTVSAGAACLFNLGACSGGTDIAAMIIKKYTKIDIGQALLMVDFVAVAFSFVVYDATTGLFSLAGLLARSFVIDTFLESVNLCKYFTIVCERPEAICGYIRKELNRSATIYHAVGGYSGQRKAVILTAVRRNQAIALRSFIRRNEPDAFLVITNSSEIVGKGFLLE